MMSTPVYRVSERCLRRLAALGLLLVGAWFVVTHFIHVFTEAINWDEFALLARAERTHALDIVSGGGRPGLASLVLVPFVRDCVDAVQSVVNARLLWQFFTLAYLAGVYALVRRWFIHAGRPDDGRAQGLLAVALLAFLPAFVVWSVQVRTDQVALAAATWAGVLLMSPSRLRAAGAGVLFGIALLCTQKALYVIVLVLILFATASIERLRTGTVSRREFLSGQALHLAITGAATLIVVVVYALLYPEATVLASNAALSGARQTMSFTRASQGYRIYTVHAAKLLVHGTLMVTLVVWTTYVIRTRRIEQWSLIATCWLMLALGLVVVVVHGSSFAYFIMTAGLFPALALSMAAGGPLALTGRASWPLVAALAALAAMQSFWESVEMFMDTQSEQRATLRLVSESALRLRRGYHVEGALFCMQDPEPLPVMFTEQIWRRFHDAPDAPQALAAFEEEFRQRQVAYIVHSYRLGHFPQQMRRFWSEHYVWHSRSLYVAGFELHGLEGYQELDLIVAGRYRWDPDRRNPDAHLELDGRILQAGEHVDLKPGTAKARTIGGATGQLLLADLPRPARTGYPAFYIGRQVRQLGGRQ